MSSNTLVISLRRFFATHFPRGEDAIWKEWVDDVSRGQWNDLISLLGSDVRDSFKKRAIFLLIVPSSEFSPLYWRRDVRLHSCGERFLDALSTISPELLSYCAESVLHFCLELRRNFCDRPKSFVEGVPGGITIFWSVPDEWHDALRAYNELILKLLALLPQEEGEKIFPFYSLRDISVFSNMDDASGYSPFERLLRSKNIAEHWKVRADLAMREIIRREIAGESKPREKWEDALGCYASIVNRFIWDKVSPYPIKLFEGQVRFLAGHHTAEQPLLEGWKLSKLLDILSESDYEFRHKLVRALVVEYRKEDWRKFSVTSDDEVKVARQLMQEFSGDKELVARLNAFIEKFDAIAAETKEGEFRKENKKKTILEKMT